MTAASPNGWPTGLLMLPSPCPSAGQAGQLLHTLSADRLCLVGTEPDRPIRHDPGYIYVEAGPDFEREHTAAYADADTAKISFNNASWDLPICASMEDQPIATPPHCAGN